MLILSSIILYVIRFNYSKSKLCQPNRLGSKVRTVHKFYLCKELANIRRILNFSPHCRLGTLVTAIMEEEYNFDVFFNSFEQLPTGSVEDDAATIAGNVESPKPTSSRFGDALDEVDLERRMLESLPDSTRAKEKWAINLFRTWKESRVQLQMQGHLSGLAVIKPIEDLTKVEINHLLQFFVFEVRKENGQKYPPGTLKNIVSMIQHYYVYTLRSPMSIWTDGEFASTRQALDAAMRETAKDGNMNGSQTASAIPAADEAPLWERGVLGDSTPKILLFTVIFLIGKVFGLRGGRELHLLQFNKEIRLTTEGEDEILLYVEGGVSKVRPCGLKTFNRPVKRNSAYHTPEHRRCLVCLYKRYVSLRPANCTKPQLFLSWFRSETSVRAGKWYQNQVLGRHTLDAVVRTVTVGLPEPAVGRFTNQSLRKTCATTLRDVGMARPEIAKITGHSSTAMERYIGPSVKVAKMASDALQNGSFENQEAETTTQVPGPSTSTSNGPSPVKSITIDGNRIDITFK